MPSLQTNRKEMLDIVYIILRYTAILESAQGWSFKRIIHYYIWGQVIER